MSDAGMSDQGKKARAAYYRKWRAEHPEKNREYVNRYWDKRSRQQNTEKAPSGETDTENGD